MSREIPCKGKRRVVLRARLQPACLHAANAFTNQLVRPCARFSSRLIRSVKIDQNVMLRSLRKQFVIKIDEVFVFVIEEIDLCSHPTESFKFAEELLARFRSPQLTRVPPEPQSHTSLP